jgi:prepilin-type N-terminal cleavage/methylation domain-containing protein
MVRRVRTQRRNDGFTLVELLVVIVVLGVLAGIVVFGVGRFRTDANAGACRADVAGVNAAADAYLAVTGNYPSSMADLTIGQYLNTAPKSGAFSFDAATRTATRDPACAAAQPNASASTPATTAGATTSPATTAGATTAPPLSGACTATVGIDNSWPQGFQASITVRNTGSSTLSPWQLSWTMSAGATLNNGWNATMSQSGTVVTAVAPDWNPALGPGVPVSVGFIADGPFSPPPSAVRLNGVACGA